MDLTIYDIILGPVVSEKASKLVNELKKIVLRVHPKSNKKLVEEALEKLFEVRVQDVRIIVRKPKTGKFKRNPFTGTLAKHAIVTLKDSESFDKLAYAGAGGVSAEASTASVGPEKDSE